MSQRQKKTHEEKVIRRQRNFPAFSEADLAVRSEIAHGFVHLVEESLAMLPTTEAVAPNAKPMWGAHLTIAHYTGERLLAMIEQDREVLAKEVDIVRVATPGLVGADGRPLSSGGNGGLDA